MHERLVENKSERNVDLINKHTVYNI